ncbi:uncharacterized protein EI97DRAFT_389638 [Westerdykella ornata]|uniref:Uncharacterized protein n=1 Tax=Westerdykella ornata TaxID=318751 RepID=A0A6A6JY96_WESOR|nr:uncharacterized protein EI97DRAFT_389638 [Westerdykella ornata]KAF2281194.1 hypothetical protein EI97DRAFT_389638 [Westerdykella ornata]
MFRSQVLRRGFSIWRGTTTSGVVRSAARNGHQTIQIQPVRIRRPFFTRSRIIGFTVTATTAYAALHWLDQLLDDLEDDEEEEEDAEDEDEDQEWQTVPQKRERDIRSESEDLADDPYDEEELEAILFIPTGFSRPKPRTRYKASDPEWQEYVRLANDPQRIRRMQEDFVVMIRTFFLRSWGTRSPIGDVDPRAGSFLLHLRYPHQPPIEYERPGIEILEDLSVQRSTRPVEEAHHHRLAALLRPVPSAQGLYAHIKGTAARVWDGIRSCLGWSAQDDLHSKEAMSSGLPGSAALIPSKPRLARDPPTGSPAASSGHSAVSPPSSESIEASSQGDTPTRKLLIPLAEIPRLDLGQFHRAFRNENARHQFKHGFSREPQRGAVVVKGEIEIRGSRGSAVALVTGHYDPKKNVFVRVIVDGAEPSFSLYSSRGDP